MYRCRRRSGVCSRTLIAITVQFARVIQQHRLPPERMISKGCEMRKRILVRWSNVICLLSVFKYDALLFGRQGLQIIPLSRVLLKKIRSECTMSNNLSPISNPKATRACTCHEHSPILRAAVTRVVFTATTCHCSAHLQKQSEWKLVLTHRVCRKQDCSAHKDVRILIIST